MVEAYKWRLLAAWEGHKDSKSYNRAKEVMTTLEPSMTPEQIAEAKRRADDWRKQHNL